MSELYTSLLELQELDLAIADAEARVAQFTPRLKEIREPVTGLEREVELANVRLSELRAYQKKLEVGAEDKREKLRLFQERVEKSRNIRDEAATRTEMDLIRRAVESEVAEGEDITEQAKRADVKVDDLQKALVRAREDIAPRESELETERAAAESELAALQDKRSNVAGKIDKASVRLYDRVRAGKRKTALAPLTVDGACGVCYNVLPMQEQAEIRRGSELRRCEACGVILYPVEAP